jgi:ATP-dependent Clp protease adaptor protein ClpS
MVTRKCGHAKLERDLAFTFELVAAAFGSPCRVEPKCFRFSCADRGPMQGSHRKQPGSAASPEAVFSDFEEVQPSMPETVTKPKTKVKIKTERPRLHKVILVNDDYTPREFVVTVLKAEFRMTDDQAYKVMITAHKLGVCVVAVFTKDVAETKATRATDAGRAKGYPLLFTTEPEE